MDEDLIADLIVDTQLDVDSLDDVVIPTDLPVDDTTGVTDGTTTTDDDPFVEDPDTVITIDGEETTTSEDIDPATLGIDITGFIAVNYTYDDDGKFVNLDDPADPYVEELEDNEAGTTPDDY